MIKVDAPPSGFSSFEEFDDSRRLKQYAGRPLPPGFEGIQDIYFSLPIDPGNEHDLRSSYSGQRIGGSALQGILYLLEMAADPTEIAPIEEAGLVCTGHCGDIFKRFPRLKEAMIEQLKNLPYGQEVIRHAFPPTDVK